MRRSPRALRVALPLALASLLAADDAAAGRIFYVRQTLGDDAHDGLAPERAWKSLSKLDAALEAGDTAYVGPGLYRDQVFLRNSGREDAPIRILADAGGAHTGDPPGVVLVTGADPVDEKAFVAHPAPGVYEARLPFRTAGVVEMGGVQRRYRGVLEPVSDVPYLEQVAALPGSFYYDPETRVLYVHTSDGRHPARHELELIRRTGGVSMTGKHYVTVAGFHFRHMLDAGVVFWTGSSHGVAADNVVWGCRQGIRVNGATDVLVTGNTLFRNENSGVYFLNASRGSVVVGNTLYENAKGVRWGSGSNGGLAVGNVAFDNLEAGIAIESTEGATLLRNRLIGNREAQLIATRARFHAEANCFARGAEARRIADVDYHQHHATLAAYRAALAEDLASREEGCGEPPGRLDVGALHARSLSYLEGARRRLGTAR